MDTSKRITAASAAAVLGLFLAGCDNTETEEAPEAPAETAVPENDIQESEIGGEAGDTGDDATTEPTGAATGADDMVPETDPEVGEGEAGGGGY